MTGVVARRLWSRRRTHERQLRAGALIPGVNEDDLPLGRPGSGMLREQCLWRDGPRADLSESVLTLRPPLDPPALTPGHRVRCCGWLKKEALLHDDITQAKSSKPSTDLPDYVLGWVVGVLHLGD